MVVKAKNVELTEAFVEAFSGFLEPRTSKTPNN